MSLIGRRYAEAIFEIGVEKNQLDEIYEQFTTVTEVLKTEKTFWVILETPNVDVDDKKAMLHDIFKGELNTSFENFLKLLFDKNRFVDIYDIYISFKEMVLKEKNLLEAIVVTVVEMSDGSLNKLKGNLEKRFNKTVLISNEIDPEILGGAVIYIGSEVIDGSVRAKLNGMKTNVKEMRLV
jgi:F-type H+-transporting ATPase subunit delta